MLQSLTEMFRRTRTLRWVSGDWRADGPKGAEFCLAGMLYHLSGFKSEDEYEGPEVFETVGDGAFVDGTGNLKLCMLGQRYLAEAIDEYDPEFRQGRLEGYGNEYDFSFMKDNLSASPPIYGTEGFIVNWNDQPGRQESQVRTVLRMAMERAKTAGV